MKDEQRRLAGVGLELGLALAVLWPFVEWSVPDPGGIRPARLVAGIGTLAGVLGVMVLARSARNLGYREIGRLGHLLLLLGTGGIAVIEQWRPLPVLPSHPGLSWAALWIFAYLFAVPRARQGRRALPLAIAFALVPLVVGLAEWSGVREPMGWMGWVVTLGPVAAAIGVHLLPSMSILDLDVLSTGSYRLIQRLGEGGMGEVWLATHKLLARPAAVKLIRPSNLGSEADARVLERRFLREAHATARLESPHTIRLFDFGVAGDGRFYYVMELLDGLDLERMVQQYGPLPPERALHLAQQACVSLAEAHAMGFIHRDVKPSNLFVCRLGMEVDHLKVLDFGLVGAREGGIASADPEMAGTQTHLQGLVGTPAFVPPESIAGLAVDARADVYSLGCVLYWLLTGRAVFPRRTMAAMLSAHLHEPPRPPSADGLVLPPELDEVVLHCLKKEPDHRPPSMEALREQLLRIPLDTPWTEERAARWWERNLPALSATRI